MVVSFDILHPKFWNLKIFHFLCAYWTTSKSVALPLKCSASSLNATLCVISPMGWIQPMATVAYQNAKRNSTVFRRLYTAYSFWTEAIWQRTKFRFKMPTKWLGSSTITLICRSTNGTLHNKERDNLLPVFANIIDGKCGGNRGALDIPVSPHSVVIADRGYCDFSLLDNWDNKNVFFVVRHRDNLHSQIEERLLPETRVQNVLIDEIIELTGEQTKKKYTKPLRRIAIWNDEHGYVVQLLTNNFKLPAPTIA